jgi:Holliday junction resolvase RusA-like endonuclease
MKVEIPMISQPWPTGEPAVAWHGQIQPVPLHRPQTVQFGRNQRGARTIPHMNDVAFRSELQIAWFQARLDRSPLEGPLAVVMEFSGNTVTRWNKRAPRPDLSNLIKSVEDAANGVLWDDDRNVMQLVASIRRWDKDAQPLVALWIWTIPAWPSLGDPGDARLATMNAVDHPGSRAHSGGEALRNRSA